MPLICFKYIFIFCSLLNNSLLLLYVSEVLSILYSIYEHKTSWTMYFMNEPHALNYLYRCTWNKNAFVLR